MSAPLDGAPVGEEAARGLPAGVVVVLVGLLVVAVGVFLPQGIAEDPLDVLESNALIADGGFGVVFLLGIAIVGLMLWFWWARGDVSWIAIAVFAATGLVVAALLFAAVAEDAIWSDIADREIATRPGSGSWAVLVGSALVFVGSLLLRTAEPEHRGRVRKPPSPAVVAAASAQQWGGTPPQQAWGAPAQQPQPWGAPAAAPQAWAPPAAQLPPAGWYPDPTPQPGTAPGLRWWDGRVWTDSLAPSPGSAPAPSAAPPRPAGPESPSSLWSRPRHDDQQR